MSWKMVSPTEMKWYNVCEKLPNHGDYIQGRNMMGETWYEVFDEDEPIGFMIEWRYAE